ncbi:MAG: hypothetical protein HC769_34790 [Cyanobacteria bacterium CRU_2_1]|nr:hypothetical protein [Cyanobacteria bacterium CRU_2_1]
MIQQADDRFAPLNRKLGFGWSRYVIGRAGDRSRRTWIYFIYSDVKRLFLAIALQSYPVQVQSDQILVKLDA